jgi:hypothetical protein
MELNTEFLNFLWKNILINTLEDDPKYLTLAYYRGYIATYEIINNELWVIKIETYGFVDNAMTLVDVTNACLRGKDRIKVDWYSGYLFIPQGDLISFDRFLLYEYIYEYFIIIEIKKGKYYNDYIMDAEEYISRVLKR